MVGRHLLVSNKGLCEWVPGGDGEVNEVGERSERGSERRSERERETETYGSSTTSGSLEGGGAVTDGDGDGDGKSLVMNHFLLITRHP